MRRLYSTFAGGWPGAGLLLMRVVAGSALVIRASSLLRSNTPSGSIVSSALLGSAGILLIPGLWTPVIGTFVALLEFWTMLTLSGDQWVPLLLATIAGSLAMLGPGLWSVDARLFGWKRVEAPPRKTPSS